MNKKFAVLILCLIGILINVQAQNIKAVIILKNGDSISGFGEIVGDNLKFRESINEKSKYHDFSTFKLVKLQLQDRIVNYRIFRVKNRKQAKVLEEVIIGKVSLYVNCKIKNNPGIIGGGNFAMASDYNVIDYYVKKVGMDEVFYLGSNQPFSKNFVKLASRFFSDCPVLSTKIQNKELKKRDINQVVEFYNKNCN